MEARWEPPAARLTAFAEWFRDLPDPVPGPAPYTAGASTIVVLPDTQVYTDVHPAIFERQTRWVAEHHEERDIRFVLHLGDVTETASPREWQSAQQAMGWLDGRVPYALATGNHDYGKHGHAESRESLLSTYFPVRAFLDDPTFGGTYNAGVLDNSFHLFSAGGRDWIALVLEWGPRHDVVQWADRVLAAHADRIAVVVTHAYLFHGDTRFDTEREDQPWNPHDYATAELPGGVYDGQELWDGLISRHGNVAMVLSGHVLGDGVGLLSSRGEQGHVVHQMLSNYQMLESGGQGYLRLLEILPDGETIQVKTYSPWLDDYKTEFDQQFRLRLDVKLEQPHRS
ncbi:MAG: metallophosphoesterase [Myxococcota bacterium]